MDLNSSTNPSPVRCLRADARLEEIFDQVRPDVIVEDNVLAFPAILTSHIPWVRIVSCNQLELKDPNLPPTFSGYPTTNRSGWDDFRHRYRELHKDLHADFSNFCMEVGAPPLPSGEFIWESPYLNFYLYPSMADYPRSRTLASTWQRLDSYVRDTDESFEIPPELGGRRETDLLESREPGIGGCRADESPRRGAGQEPASSDYQQRATA